MRSPDTVILILASFTAQVAFLSLLFPCADKVTAQVTRLKLTYYCPGA